MNDVEQVLLGANIRFTDHGSYVKIRCVNPHHPGGDVHPSMTVKKDSGYFKCWSCGFKGGFKKLCRIIGGDLSIADSLLWNYTNRNITEGKKEYKIEALGEFYSVYDNPSVMAYLRERNVTDEFIDNFELAYINRIQINGSFWKNRVCIPIYEAGNLVNIEGRDYTKQQTKKVLYPKNSKAGVIFNFDDLDLTKPVVLVEGVMDLPGLYQVYKNVGAVFGNQLSMQQIDDINKIEKLIVIPDNDAGGRVLVNTIDEHYAKDFEVCSYDKLPDKKDPGQCTVDELKRMLDERVSIMEYVATNMDVYSRQLKFDW